MCTSFWLQEDNARLQLAVQHAEETALSAQLQLHAVQEQAALDAASAAEAAKQVEQLQKQLELLRSASAYALHDDVVALEMHRLVREAAHFKQKVWTPFHPLHTLPHAHAHSYLEYTGYKKLLPLRAPTGRACACAPCILCHMHVGPRAVPDVAVPPPPGPSSPASCTGGRL